MSNWLKRVQHLALFQKQWFLPSALALLGAMFLYGGVATYKAKLGYGMVVRKVAVASREMPEGHVISRKNLTVALIPDKYLPVGTLLTSDAHQAVGHVVTRPIAKGELVLWSAFDVKFTGGPARRIADGYRALAVKVGPATSIGRAIRPGDHVDILTTVSLLGENVSTTLTLLQNVAVLDVGEAVEEGRDRSYSTITLMILPKEMGLITYAQEHGTLTFALRNPEDHRTPTDLPLIGHNELIATAFRNSLQQERNQTIEVIRGGKVSLEPAVLP